MAAKTKIPVKRRAVRRSEAEFREHVLQTAATMVERMNGLRVDLDDDFDFEKVIAEAGVSRSTAYRYWKTKEEFSDDLLCYLSGPWRWGAASVDRGTIEVASGAVVEHLDRLGTPEGRQEVVREAVRLAAAENFRSVSQQVQWRTYLTLTATVLSLPKEAEQRRRRLLAALRESEVRFIGEMASFYQDMALVLGFKLKYENAYDVLAAAGASIMDGLALRQIALPELAKRTFEAPGLDQQMVDWTLPALAFMGIVEALVEPDPDYDPTVALAEYFRRASMRPAEASPAVDRG
jgi:AcrR family transcriptional regulator